MLKSVNLLGGLYLEEIQRPAEAIHYNFHSMLAVARCMYAYTGQQKPCWLLIILVQSSPPHCRAVMRWLQISSRTNPIQSPAQRHQSTQFPDPEP
jgi:hypothetical protein